MWKPRNLGFLSSKAENSFVQGKWEQVFYLFFSKNPAGLQPLMAGFARLCSKSTTAGLEADFIVAASQQ